MMENSDNYPYYQLNPPLYSIKEASSNSAMNVYITVWNDTKGGALSR